MKKLKKIVTSVLLLVILVVAVYYSKFYMKGPDINAKSFILIDSSNKKVLFGKNETAPFAAASMTKMMTEYLLLESIHHKRISWNDHAVISENSLGSEGVKINVKKGDRLTVKDLYSAMVVASANNAAVAVAEKLSGSEKAFIKTMNEKAADLGLSNKTRFVNATGLTDKQGQESQMTAFDVAILAYHLVHDYPEVLETTKLAEYRLAYDGTVLISTNSMLIPNDRDITFEGVDGLKTGFTDQAGYCFAGTAIQGNKRLITVVMGAEEKMTRFTETKKLLAYGFNRPYVPSIKSLAQRHLPPYLGSGF